MVQVNDVKKADKRAAERTAAWDSSMRLERRVARNEELVRKLQE